jgi:hypothetical protein
MLSEDSITSVCVILAYALIAGSPATFASCLFRSNGYNYAAFVEICLIWTSLYYFWTFKESLIADFNFLKEAENSIYLLLFNGDWKLVNSFSRVSLFNIVSAILDVLPGCNKWLNNWVLAT